MIIGSIGNMKYIFNDLSHHYQMDKKYEAIWKKLLSWDFVLQFTGKNEWIKNYKRCCVDIYLSLPRAREIDSLKEKIIKYNGEMKNTMSNDDYHKVTHNFMALICYFSTDPQHILTWYCENFCIDYDHKFIIEHTYHYIPYEPSVLHNFLSFCLEKSKKSLNVIKYLVEKCGVKITFYDDNLKDNLDCLYIMINSYDYRFGCDLKIIKYFIDHCKIPVDCNDDNDILYDVFENPLSDIRLIDYLIKKNCKIQWHYFTNLLSSYHISIKKSIMNDKNKFENMREKMRYLVNNNHDNEIIFDFPPDFDHRIFKECLKYIDDHKICNALILQFNRIKKYQYNTSNIFNDIFDLMLQRGKFSTTESNPFYFTYGNFIEYVDNFEPLTCHYDSYIYYCDKKDNLNNGIYSNLINYSNPCTCSCSCTCSNSNIEHMQLLFYVNQIPYYDHGNKKRIYEQMLIFKDNDMIQVLDQDPDQDPIILTASQGNVKEYLVNIYLNTIVNCAKINLNQIDPFDIFDFLKFIEQYPADCLSIETIEIQLIDYFNLHDIDIPTEIQNLFHRCGLKLMYLYVHHNKLFSELCRENNLYVHHNKLYSELCRETNER